HRCIDVAAANHSEAVGRRDVARAIELRDRLLAGIDDIRVHFIGGRKGAGTQNAVLRLQPNIHARPEVVRDERRNADTEIHVVAVFELASGARRHFFTCPHLQATSARIMRRSIRFSLLVAWISRCTKIPGVWIWSAWIVRGGTRRSTSATV